jgi:phosphonate transport system ATP-binding protein
MSTNLLVAKDLGLHLSNRWLFRKLSFSVPGSSFVAITGPSGVGKTSLMRLLSGDLKGNEGNLESNLSTDEKISMIFQDLQLANGASTLANALGGCLGRHSSVRTLMGFPKQEKDSALKWLSQFGLAQKTRQWASTLSRGERQRLAICRSLISRPKLLLADEPVASLDNQWADETLSILKTNQLQTGGSLVCSLHDEEQVQKHADFVLRLHADEPESWSWENVAA